MFRKTLGLLVFSYLLINNIVQSQYVSSDTTFGSPFKFPIVLSGSFGELRNDHFHSGIDIKTQGVVGKPIYAIADGFVSRIKVSAWGYGYALYLQHYNGYVSVYGHLEKYNKTIDAYVKQFQYKNKCFEFDISLDSTEIKVNKGEVIAFAGNSGFSGGPHLHFEIRNTKDECLNNPLLFGFNLTDNVPPIIEAIKIYPFQQASINGADSALIVKTQQINNQFVLFETKPIEISGKFAVGIQTFDRMNNTRNHYGVYSIELFVDKVKIYEHEMKGYCFNESRYINSLIDYEHYQKTKQRFQKSFIEPNNKLSIYKTIKNNGYIEFQDTLIHSIRYVISDFYKNKAELSFEVKSSINMQKQSKAIDTKGTIFRYDSENYFSQNGCMLYLPKDVLYSSINFSFKTLPRQSNTLTKVYQIHDIYTPVHHKYAISINGNEIDDSLRTKCFIASIKKNKVVYEGGKWCDNYLMTHTNHFGSFSICADTTSPSIKLLNFKDGDNVSTFETLKIEITDDITGIKSYDAYLNGDWILMEYDGKKDLLTLKIDNKFINGLNIVQLVVKDLMDNAYKISNKVYFNRK